MRPYGIKEIVVVISIHEKLLEGIMLQDIPVGYFPNAKVFTSPGTKYFSGHFVLSIEVVYANIVGNNDIFIFNLGNVRL